MKPALIRPTSMLIAFALSVAACTSTTRSSSEPTATADETSNAAPVPIVDPPAPTTTTAPACVAGPTIPAGTYAGILQGHFRLLEHKPGQGAIDEVIDKGDVNLVSNGTTVSGTLSMHWHGAGDVNMGGGVSFHIEEDSILKDGVLSGPVTDPVVDGTIVGQETVDGDATNGSRPVHLHLHITAGSCNGLSGDAVAMLQETVDGRFDTIDGAAAWVTAWRP